MAYVVSSLPDFKQLDREKLISAAVLGGRTIERISVQTGIKKDALINYLALDPVFQSGADCGFNASGNVTFTQRTISTAPIKVNESFCPQTLLGKYTEYQVKISANAIDDAMPFEDFIADLMVKKINAEMEKAVWQGDTTSATPNLARFDGFIKLADNDANVIDVAIAYGTSAWNAIKAVYAAIPETALEKAEINVSPALFRQFILELVEKNFFHYAPDGEMNEIRFPGTETKVVKVNGLAGVNKIYATDPANMYYGCDLENATEDFKIWFSDDNDQYRMKVLWNAGVQHAFGDQIVLGTIATQ